MTPNIDPLDEQQWFAPTIVQEFGGSLHSDNILYYFARSVFFDSTSNNATLIVQGSQNPEMAANVLSSRQRFEAHLQSMGGLEFVVADVPKAGQSDIWVINKQRRTRTSQDNWEVVVLAVYFVVGIKIFQAPNIYDVLSNRMTAILCYLKKSNNIITGNLNWDSATGYSYTKPKVIESSVDSEEQTTKDRGDPLDHSFIAGVPPAPPSLVEEALNHVLAYGNEYLDQSPITGMPGNFHLSSGRIQSGNTKDSFQQAGSGLSATLSGTSAPPRSIPGANANTTAPAGAKHTKTEGTDHPPKPKRRKSAKTLTSGH